MKKADLFKAQKTMSTRVEEYVKCRVLRKAIMKTYEGQIKAYDALIASLENLSGSILAEKSEERRVQYTAERQATVDARNKQLKDEATFELTDGDKKFKKSIKGLAMDDTGIKSAVIAWFKNYNLDVDDTYLLKDVLDAIGGKESIDKLVDTNGLDGVVVDETRALNMLYWVAFRHMATVGTIKAAQIPDIVKDNFGTAARKAKAEAKKAAKKTEKTAA